MIELTQEQKDRIISLIKRETGDIAYKLVNSRIEMNRNTDLLDTIPESERETHTGKVERYQTKINDYNKMIDMYQKDLDLLESIETVLTS